MDSRLLHSRDSFTMDLIDNNSAHGLGDSLCDILDPQSHMAAIASYFTIVGYSKLCNVLQDIQEFRFIFDGSPSSIR